MPDDRRLVQIRVAPRLAVALKIEATVRGKTIQDFVEGLLEENIPAEVVRQADLALQENGG